MGFYHTVSSAFRQLLALSVLVLAAALPLNAWAVDSDGDGADDSVDAFPANAQATADTDHDGIPDSINTTMPAPNLGPFSLLTPYSLYLQGTNQWISPTTGSVSYSAPRSQVCGLPCQYQSALKVTVNVPAGSNGSISFYESFSGVGSYQLLDNSAVLHSKSNTSFSGTVSFTLAPGDHTLYWLLASSCSLLSGCQSANLSLSNLVTQNLKSTSWVADTDDDNDGALDTADKFPLNAAAIVDDDNDGFPDRWATNNPYSCTDTDNTCNGLTLDQSAPQSITITQAAPTSKAYGGYFYVIASASSGLPVSIVGSGGCTGTGTDSVSITMTSSSLACTVTYSQAGGGRYLPATDKVSTTTATKATQVITVTQAAPASAAYGAVFTVAATASSSLPVSIAASGGCSIMANTVTMTSSTTTCTVTYSQAGDSNYSAATNKSSSTTATKANQSITVTQPAPASAAYGSSFDVAATASSGLPVNIAASGGCSIAGNTVTMTGDNCQLLYSQAGDANYNAVSPMTSSTTVLSNLPLDGAYKGSAVQEQVQRP